MEKETSFSHVFQGLGVVSLLRTARDRRTGRMDRWRLDKTRPPSRQSSFDVRICFQIRNEVQASLTELLAREAVHASTVALCLFSITSEESSPERRHPSLVLSLINPVRCMYTSLSELVFCTYLSSAFSTSTDGSSSF